MVRNILHGLDVKLIELHGHFMLQMYLQVVKEDCDVFVLVLDIKLI